MKLLRLFSVFLLTIAMLSPLPAAQAGRLSDLIKREPELYLPSQVLPGHPVTLTLRGKAGQNAQILMSSKAQGATLANGFILRVGKPTAQAKGVIPETGVWQVTLDVPANIDQYADVQYFEGIVWSAPDQSDAAPAKIINPNATDTNNSVAIGFEANGGYTMIIPGDPNLSNVFRSLGTINEISQDPRKKQLLDTGDINRDRLLDKNLNVSPLAAPF